MPVPVLDPGVEDRPEQRVLAHPGIEGVHQALDHRLVDPRRLRDRPRDLRAPLGTGGKLVRHHPPQKSILHTYYGFASPRGNTPSAPATSRSEEHTSEIKSLMSI